jgi:hypothetical protein
MDVDEFVESEVAIAVAATAAILSPRVRGVLRSGVVYGLAGALIAGDTIGSIARGVGRGTRQTAASAGGVAQEAVSTAAGVARSAAERTRGAEGTAQGEA